MRITSIVTTILLCGAFMASPCAAAPVYKCKGTTGETIYQNTPCPSGTQQLGRGEYNSAPDAPSRYDSAGDVVNQISARQDTTRDAGGLGAVRPNDPVAYHCSTDKRTWIQSTPCPETSTRVVSSSCDVDGTVVGTGQRVNGLGTCSRREVIQVRTQPLDKSAACASLSKNARTAEKGRNADSTYERNKMRDQLNCR